MKSDISESDQNFHKTFPQLQISLYMNDEYATTCIRNNNGN